MTDDMREYLEDMKINIYKLIDGSTIVAKCITATLNHHVIAYPMQAKIDLNNANVALHRWMYLGEDHEVRLKSEHIISFVQAEPDLKKLYDKLLLQSTLFPNLDPSFLLSEEYFLGLIRNLDQSDPDSD